MDAQSEKCQPNSSAARALPRLAHCATKPRRFPSTAFIHNEDFSAFYIFVSRLAQHTVDMQKDNRVSLMICETDDGRDDPQTLARVSIRGKAEMIQNGEPGYTPLKQQYLARFPESH